MIYRPGTGDIVILQNNNGTFVPVYRQGAPENGIGNFALLAPGTFAFAFDYGHSGNLDYLVFYVPGQWTFWILQNVNGNFSAVYGKALLAMALEGMISSLLKTAPLPSTMTTAGDWTTSPSTGPAPAPSGSRQTSTAQSHRFTKKEARKVVSEATILHLQRISPWPLTTPIAAGWTTSSYTVPALAPS